MLVEAEVSQFFLWWGTLKLTYNSERERNFDLRGIQMSVLFKRKSEGKH